MSVKFSRSHYINLYGPPMGARVRLGDTSLIAEVEHDCNAYGDECVFSAGLSLRDGLGLTATADKALDAVITNAVIVDWSGIYKADIGIKAGRIAGLGKAGNPDSMSGVTPGLVVGANTTVIPGEGLIATAGAVDASASFNEPSQLLTALAAGVTTILGGCSGSDDREAVTGATGARALELLLRATDTLPLNVGVFARCGSPRGDALGEIVQAGAAGLFVHESFGSPGSSIDCALETALKFDLPFFMRADSVAEAFDFDGLRSTFNKRPVTLQINPFGGGAMADSLLAAGDANLLCYSTTASLAASLNTVQEQRGTAAVRRRHDAGNPKQETFVERSLHPGLFAAEDILHDLGAIPIIASGAGYAGRSAEVISRAWQLAHKMSQQRGRLKGEKGRNDNLRIRRFIAKYTINPAIASGVSHEVGSLENGKLANIVLWKPAFFGVRPELVIKGGAAVAGQRGPGSSAMGRTQPVRFAETCVGTGKAASEVSLAFVSKHSLRQNTLTKYGLRKYLSPVKSCRHLARSTMRLNDATPEIALDRHRGALRCDGEVLACEPAEVLPLAQRYSLF